MHVICENQQNGWTFIYYTDVFKQKLIKNRIIIIENYLRCFKEVLV